MDLTHIHEMKAATAQAWQVMKERDPAGRTLVAKDLLFRLSESDTDGVMVYSRPLAAFMGWQHFNMLRTLKRFAETHQEDKGWFCLKRRTMCGGFVLWLPTLQRFIVWLLKELEGHEADQLRRQKGFIEALGFLSGLRCVLKKYEDYSTECMTAWPVEAEQDKLTWQPSSASQLTLDFTAAYTRQPSDKVHLTQLSCQCGYSLRHMERHIKAARHEFEDLADPDFLTVSDAGLVSAKTSMFILLSMPKTLRTRLKIFNHLYSKTQKKPLVLPPDLPNYLVGTDFTDPETALNACVRMCGRLQSQHAFHTEQKGYWEQETAIKTAHIDILRSDLAGREKQISDLKTSLMQAKATGSLIREPTEDTAVYHAGKLRGAHGWVTLRDVERSIADHLGFGNVDVLLRELGLSKVNTRGSAIRRIVKYTLCQKNNRADGQFVLNQLAYDNEYAAVKRVYVPTASSTGHRATHGTDRDWRWGFFITPKGQQWLEHNFATLAKAYVEARSPEHAQASEVEEV